MRPLAAALLLCLAAPAAATKVAGVELPDTAEVGGKTLLLNGAGVRSRFIVKVYVGALYLEQKSGDAAAILAADAPWKVSMRFLRDVEKEKIVGAFKEGFENNSKGDLPALLPGLAALGALHDLKSGDELAVTYVPGTGATVAGPGGVSVHVEGRVFAAALLRNWLGARPADGDLKKGMLGSR
jgi:hypothetical protein